MAKKETKKASAKKASAKKASAKKASAKPQITIAHIHDTSAKPVNHFTSKNPILHPIMGEVKKKAKHPITGK